jgi:hypothetical protein
MKTGFIQPGQTPRTGLTGGTGKHRSIRHIAAVLFTAIAVSTISTGTAVQAKPKPKATKVNVAYEGNGVVRGLDFNAAGTGRMNPLGSMKLVVNNDPSATRPEGIVEGRLILRQVSTHTYTLKRGQIFLRGADRFSFALLADPSGNPITDPGGNPIPDTSKEVTSTSELTILGGTGGYQNATGRLSVSGVITPEGPPPTGPESPLNVSFTFSGRGTVTPNSGGGSEPLVFDPPVPQPTSQTAPSPTTTAAPGTTVATTAPSNEVRELPVRGPVSAGLYRFETDKWRFTVKLGDGWLINGRDKDSAGLIKGNGTSDFVGLVVVDTPRTYTNVAEPLSPVIDVPSNVGEWLQSIPGVSVDGPIDTTIGTIVAKEYKWKFAPIPGGPARIALFHIGAAGFVPVPFGPLPNQVFQTVVLEKNGSRAVVGFGGGTADPSQPLRDTIVSAEPK